MKSLRSSRPEESGFKKPTAMLDANRVYTSVWQRCDPIRSNAGSCSLSVSLLHSALPSLLLSSSFSSSSFFLSDSDVIFFHSFVQFHCPSPQLLPLLSPSTSRVRTASAVISPITSLPPCAQGGKKSNITFLSYFACILHVVLLDNDYYRSSLVSSEEEMVRSVSILLHLLPCWLFCNRHFVMSRRALMRLTTSCMFCPCSCSNEWQEAVN